MAYSNMSLQELQDEIDLYQTLLNSLNEEEGLEGMDVDREYYNTKLAELRAQVARMGNTWSGSQASQSTRPESASSAVSRPASTPQTGQSSKKYLSLPSRKRERGELDDEVDTKDLPRIKSRRSTPADSPALSYADSVGSDYFDDLELGNGLGSDWQEQNREYMRKQEEKKRQEEEDERLARELQEQWNLPPAQSRPSQGQHSQATFRPNGSFSVAAPPAKREQSEVNGSSAGPRVKDEVSTTGSDTPVSVSSEDDDFTTISRTEWNRLHPSAPSRVLPNSFNQSQRVPGSFPTTQSGYSSMPGTSVYGSSSQPQQNTWSFNGLPSLPSLASVPGIGGLLGSANRPFDLERIFGGSNGALPRRWETPTEVDPRETQEEIRQLLHNIRPDEEIDPSEANEEQPEALKARLMPHQKKGLAWMKKMEESSTKGGILADDMGLGKTLQAISLMLARPPQGKVKRPTLVVTPVALMEQWKREISKMVRSRAQLTVLILHTQKSSTRSWDKIQHYDVVLTSYGTLASELRRKLKWDEKLKLNPDAIKKPTDECAFLDDKSKFHRIILDEAQNIKNKGTQAAMAACRVQADYRWCLSGTPMQNSVDEIYSLIKFCRIRPFNDVELFNKQISRPLKNKYEEGQKRAMEKLQALLKSILLRRTKKSTIDGKPILQLPEKHTVETRAVFGKDQLDFYKALETQSRIQFNKFVKAGTVGQNYSKALVLLLRLRQCCCSPQLVTNSADFVTDSGIEGIDLIANAKSLPKDVVKRIMEQEELECPVCMDVCEHTMIFNPCGHTICQDCFSRMVDSVHAESEDVVKCPHCRAKIDSKKITDHASFKEVYLGEKRTPAEDDETASEDSDEAEDDSDSEAASDDSFWDDSDVDNKGNLKNFIVNDDKDVEAEDDSEDEDDLDNMKKPKKAIKSTSKPDKKKHKDKSKKKSKGKKKSKQVDTVSLAQLRKEGVKSLKAKRKYLRQLSKLYEPCTKIDKLLELLETIEERGENEKTIVFSSFTSFLDLIEVPLAQDERLSNYTRYDGSMTARDRNEAVMRFTDDPECRVILVSLKAGNAGLNLTVANHVVILDPFWNPFVEYQAADRCHRIGQKREVMVHKVLIGEEGVDYEDEAEKEQDPPRVFTVEDRILALQEKKRRLVESALDENAASGISRLGVRELGYLFGVESMPAVAGS